MPLRVHADGPCERIEPGGPGDCDRNGFADDCDLAPHALGFAVREIDKPATGLHYEDLSGDDDVLFTLDLEPDGDTDPLFLGDNEALSYTNRGGSFDAPRRLPIPFGFASTAIADIDVDGILDIVMADRLGLRRGTVSAFRGDGAGAFQASLGPISGWDGSVTASG